MDFSTRDAFLLPFRQLLETLENLPDDSVPLRVGIIMSPYLQDMSDAINFYINKGIDPTGVKMSSIHEALSLVRRVQNRLSLEKELDGVYMRLITLGNFLRLALTRFRGEDRKVDMIASANLLSQLIIDEIVHIEALPEFGDVGSHFYQSRFFDVFNAIQTTLGVYEELLSVLDMVSRSNFIEWSERAFHQYRLMFDHVSRLDLQTIISERKVKEWDRLTTAVYSMVNAMSGLPQLAVNVASRLALRGDSGSINTSGFLDDFSRDSILELWDWVFRQIEGVVRPLFDGYDNHIVPKNDDPKRHPYHFYYLLAIEEMDSLKAMLEVFDCNGSAIPERLDTFVSGRRDAMQELVQEAGGEEGILGSDYVNFLIMQFEEFLPYVGLQSILDGDRGVFDSFLKDFSFLTAELSIETQPILLFTLYYWQLTVDLHFGVSVDFPTVRGRLLEFLPALENFPREYVAVNALVSVIDITTGEGVDVDKITADLSGLFPENVMGQTFVMDFLLYLEKLDALSNGKTIDFSEFDGRREFSPFDPWSFHYPEFSNVPYVPFNRSFDSVVVD